MESLQGMFLVATNGMRDPRFQQAVILICNHNEQGALGLVLTKVYEELSFIEILQSLNLDFVGQEEPDVYLGGPVSLDAPFILHTGGYSDQSFASIQISADIFMGNNLDLFPYLAEHNDPQEVRFFLGYSGWGPGQLDQELALDGWLVLPASAPDIFSCSPDLLWQYVTKKNGIDITLFNDSSGKA